jgi:hypothetical protein
MNEKESLEFLKKAQAAGIEFGALSLGEGIFTLSPTEVKNIFPLLNELWTENVMCQSRLTRLIKNGLKKVGVVRQLLGKEHSVKCTSSITA